MIDKIIISDTSRLIALDRIKQLQILHKLFPVILTTKEIQQEFGDLLPKWIIIQPLKNSARKEELQEIVDEGEASAIALALETENCILIIDERKGRRLAQELKIEITGTLQILLIAKSKGLISSLTKLLAELELNNFRFSKSIGEEILRKANEL